MKQGAGFPVKVQGEHKFRFDGNWKIQLENTTDGYHFPIVHRSWMSSVDAETADMLSFMTDEQAVTHALGNGHSVADHGPGARRPGGRRRHRRTAGALRATSSKNSPKTMPPEQVRRIVRSMHGAGFNLNLFPNVAMSMSFFRVLRPISVNETEIQHMALGLDGGPEIVNRERLRIHEHFQGPVRVRQLRRFRGLGPGAARARTPTPRCPILVNRGLGREVTAEEGWKTSHVTDETGMRECLRTCGKG